MSHPIVVSACLSLAAVLVLRSAAQQRYRPALLATLMLFVAALLR